MANRQAIEGAIRAADARLDRLAPMIEVYGDDRLLDDGGKWSIRDTLCHVALSAKISVAGQRALQRVKGEAPPQTPPAPGAPSMDERNRQAIDGLAGKSIAELVADTKAAHAAAWQDIRGMDDASLDTKVPATQEGQLGQSVGGIILRNLEYHEGGQMDRIEAALKARTRWV